MERKPIRKDDVRALARTARLALPEERVGHLQETMQGILPLLDSLDAVELGETAPAFAYRAKWEG